MIEYVSETGISVKQVIPKLFTLEFSSELVNKYSNDSDLGRVIREALLEMTEYIRQINHIIAVNENNN